MAKKKKRKLVTKEINFLLLALAFILAVGIIATKKYNPTKKITEVIQESEKKQQEYPIDTENDGIYINYQYQFKFEYPEELFETQSTNGGPNYVNWFANKDDVNDKPALRVYVRDESQEGRENAIRLFNEMLESGEKSVMCCDTYIVKIEEYPEYTTIKSKHDPESKNGMSYGFGVLKKGYPYIGISLTVNEDTANNQMIMDEIIDSFTFIESTSDN